MKKKKEDIVGIKLQRQLIEIHNGMIIHFQTQMDMRNVSQTPFLRLLKPIVNQDPFI